MIAISVLGLDDLTAKLQRLRSLDGPLAARSQTLAEALRQKAEEALSGGALETRSGKLKDSLAEAVENDGNTVSASVSAGDNVPYAAILEYGGVTKAHIIEAVNGKALAFAAGGKQLFYKQIQHPGSVIPPHPYLGPALAESEEEILGEFEQALAEAMRG